MTLTVGYLVGSLSASSINRRLARGLARVAPQGMDLVEIQIGDLPLYNRDLDGDYPEAARRFKEALDSVDALLWVTPEYNRSIPAALKNAIEWGSRPWGNSSFTGKPSAVIGASVGPIATAAAQQHMRAILGFLDSPQMGQPEGYITFTPGLVTDDGEITNESTAEFLTAWMRSFEAHILQNVERVAA